MEIDIRSILIRPAWVGLVGLFAPETEQCPVIDYGPHTPKNKKTDNIA